MPHTTRWGVAPLNPQLRWPEKYIAVLREAGAQKKIVPHCLAWLRRFLSKRAVCSVPVVAGKPDCPCGITGRDPSLNPPLAAADSRSGENTSDLPERPPIPTIDG
jgi:hypothetical protein